MPLLGTASTRSTSPRTAGASARCSTASGCKAPPYATAHGAEEALAARARASASRCSCARATCSAAARWRSSTRSTASRTTSRAGRRRRRARDLPRPLPGERDRGRRRRALRRRGRLDRRDHAARRGGRHPLRRLGLRAAAALARRTRCSTRSASATRDIALALGVVGLINVQYAVLGDELYVIEANPRASRTVPFVSKATGVPLAKMACRVMLGERIADLDLPADPAATTSSVKEAVLPVRPLPRLRRAARPGDALDRRGDGRRAATSRPRSPRPRPRPARGCRAAGTVFLTVTDADKPAAVGIAAQLHDLGFRIVATRGTAAAIARMGIPVERLNKIGEGSPHVVDWIERGDVDLVINTPTGTGARSDGYEIRRAAVARGIPCITTISGGMAAARAIAAARAAATRRCVSLQEIHARRAPASRRERRAPPRERPHARAARPPARRGDRAPRASAPTRALAAPTPTAPRREPGQFYMLAAAERWGGGGRAAVPAARVLGRCGATPTARLEFLLEDVGPGTRRLGELRPGRRAVAARPARRGFAPPRDGRRAGARRRRGRDRAAGDLAGRRSAATRAGAARLPRRRPRRGRRAAAPTRASPPTTARSATTASSPTCSPPSSTPTPRAEVYACGPPPMLEAVRALCAERERPGAARAGVRHGVRVRRVLRLRRPDPRRLRAPVRRRAGARRRRRSTGGPGGVSPDDFCGIELAHPIVNALGHVRRDRRAARVRRRAARALPVRRLRVQDGHARAARGQPAAAAVGARRRDDQLDRPAQQGPGRLPRRRTCPSSPSCPCR